MKLQLLKLWITSRILGYKPTLSSQSQPLKKKTDNDRDLRQQSTERPRTIEQKHRGHYTTFSPKNPRNNYKKIKEHKATSTSPCCWHIAVDEYEKRPRRERPFNRGGSTGPNLAWHDSSAFVLAGFGFPRIYKACST